MDFFIQIIAPLHKKEAYQKDLVINYIGKYYPDYKYYGTYDRKNSEFVEIHRFYIHLPDGKKKTLSILPAFLFSRKRESLSFFFKLLHKYSKTDFSLEKIWGFYDPYSHFQNFKRLRFYFNILKRDLNEILSIINSDVICYDPNSEIYKISPGEMSIKQKLKIFFKLLEKLIDLIHRKKLSGIILEEERFSFFHSYYFKKTGKVLLNTS